jgi:hypothetical protein
MFAGLEEVLLAGGQFCLYGPFNESGNYTSDSNAAFDRQLRTQDPLSGLRDIDELDSRANRHQMKRTGRFQMPANNQLLVFTKR